MNLKSFLSVGKLSIIFLLIYTNIAVNIGGGETNENFKTLLTVTSFMFGIFVAFAISNSNARFTKITEELEADESILLNLYLFSGIFGPKIKHRIQELADVYLVDQLDHYLFDYKDTKHSFLQLYHYIINEVKPSSSNKPEEIAYGKMLGLLSNSLKTRKQVELLIRQPMLKLEWVCIIALLLVMLFCIFYMNDQSAISILASVLLATAATTFTLILRDLNNLRWKESAWVWEDTSQLFEELDLLPYFPNAIYNSGAIKLPKGKKVRVATYPNMYPNFDNKQIDIIET